MKTLSQLVIFLISISLFNGQTLPPKQAYPFNIKQIHSGHSLTDPLFNTWPGQYVHLIAKENSKEGWELFNTMVGKSTIPGSPIMYRWENRIGNGEPDARTNISNWQLLTITERVPLYLEGANTQEWYLQGIQDQKEYLSQYVNNAWQNGDNGNGAPTLLWTTWTNINNIDVPWRQMLDIQGAEFERMQDYANANRPIGAPPVYIIPGHKVMAKLYDDILQNLVPGISNIDAFFSDTIHPNDLGAYLVTLVHYACIFNKSPVGLPANLFPIPSARLAAPSPELALYLQTMVWDVVNNYSRTGIATQTPLAISAQISLTTKIENKLAHLSWSADTKSNDSHFIVEHSIEGKIFKPLTQIETNTLNSESSNYSYFDQTPYLGINYYRIKQIDSDGKFVYSNISALNYDIESQRFTIYPNPVSNILHLKNTSQKNDSEFQIFDSKGKIVMSGKGYDINISNLPSGVYSIKSGLNVTKFIK